MHIWTGKSFPGAPNLQERLKLGAQWGDLALPHMQPPFRPPFSPYSLEQNQNASLVKRDISIYELNFTWAHRDSEAKEHVSGPVSEQDKHCVPDIAWIVLDVITSSLIQNKKHSWNLYQVGLTQVSALKHISTNVLSKKCWEFTTFGSSPHPLAAFHRSGQHAWLCRLILESSICLSRQSFLWNN